MEMAPHGPQASICSVSVLGEDSPHPWASWFPPAACEERNCSPFYLVRKLRLRKGHKICPRQTRSVSLLDHWLYVSQLQTTRSCLSSLSSGLVVKNPELRSPATWHTSLFHLCDLGEITQSLWAPNPSCSGGGGNRPGASTYLGALLRLQ